MTETPKDGTPTPPEVIDAATETARLPRVAVIGIFGPETALRALVRTSDGTITRVGPGDDIAGGKVSAIAPDKVHLANPGGTRVLEMPAA